MLLVACAAAWLQPPPRISATPRMLTSIADDDDVGFLELKLKAAVAAEDYASAALIKARIDSLQVAPEPSTRSPAPVSKSTSTARRTRKNGVTTVCATTAHTDSGAASVTAALEADGVVRVNGAITKELASELRECVQRELEDAMRDTREDADTYGDAWQARFGNVLSRPNRHDVKLSLESPLVRAALTSLLSTLEPAIARTLGADAELYELAALVSLPGASRQPVHPDTPIAATKGTDQGATILTAFTALQDVEPAMGPTLFLPATHTAEAHEEFFTYDNFELSFSAFSDEEEESELEQQQEDAESAAARAAAADELLEKWSTWRSELSAGDVSLFDSRCLHAGDENASANPRILFYCSFIKAHHASSCEGTLLEGLRRKHKLEEWREFAALGGTQRDSDE